MLRVGVVGVGAMGQHHVRVYSSTKGCTLIGVLDINSERASEIAKEYNVATFANVEDMLAAKPDAVSIAVPTSLHKEISIKFLERGIHCLVEKPIASTVEDAEVMIKSAKEHDAILMVGHIERFNPAVSTLKSIISDGELGQVLSISAKRAGPFDPRVRDVGIIIDLMTHDIDVCRYLVGREPLSVHAVYGKYKRDVEDFASMIIDFGGVIATLEANRFTPNKVRNLTATGSIGVAALDYIDQTIEILTHSYKRRIATEKVEPLRIEIEHFLESIKSQKKPLVDGEEGLKNLKIALEALRCGSSG
ncbi:MAG: Gfo/Idh/MocA family oxidoreductase [Candidatus Methanomethylicaceae archaeon]